MTTNVEKDLRLALAKADYEFAEERLREADDLVRKAEAERVAASIHLEACGDAYLLARENPV